MFRSTKLHKKFLAVLLLAGPRHGRDAARGDRCESRNSGRQPPPPRASSSRRATLRSTRRSTRIKADIAKKGIRFFDEIDHTQLGASADLPINRSKLLLFGNPPLGVQFLQANPVAGLDWPVRMLVTQDDDGTVWVSWSDFRFVADRYQLADRDKQIAMASEVAASIASSTRK